VIRNAGRERTGTSEFGKGILLPAEAFATPEAADLLPVSVSATALG
jgi:hypothetical protein